MSLTKACEPSESDRQSIILQWIDHLPPQLDLDTPRSSPESQLQTPTSIANEKSESCACAISGDLPFEIDVGPDQRKRKRKRGQEKPEMDDSDGISVGSSSGFMTNRPILEPTPPSSKKTTRTPSPTRKLLTQLESARPPVKCCQPGNSFGPLPEHVMALRRCLAKDLGKACIPRDLELRLRTVARDELEDADDAVFSDEFTATEELEAYWEKVQLVYIEAERCQNGHKDENAWVEVSRAVFRAAGLATPLSPLEINSIQTQQISPDLLPILPNAITPVAKRADLAFGLNPHNAHIQEVLQEVSAARPGISFSHMTDAYTSTIPLVSGIEVKESGGDYNEAVIQLAIWSAAGLEKVRQLRGRHVDIAEAEPFIGWTVVGHEWRLHIAWKERGGRVVVMGPWSSMRAGTASYLELFVLLDLIKRVTKWVLEVYWPWLSKEMLRPVGNQ